MECPCLAFTSSPDLTQTIIIRIQHLISDSPDGVDDMQLADIDGDGFIDIVTSSWQEDGLDFYRNNGLSGFDAPIRITTNNYGPFALGDFNEDNSIDIVFISASGTTMFWMQNDGTGSFMEQAATIPI